MLRTLGNRLRHPNRFPFPFPFPFPFVFVFV